MVAAKRGSVLAIDADPNSCLAEALGIKSSRSIVGICEEISKKMDKVPAGMTKESFIEMEIQEAVIEDKGFDLLVMGRPEGPGCYCYVNNLLRGLVTKIASNYDFVVIDNAAGMEHISRRTMGVMNKLILVSDYSVSGVRSAKKIWNLARELGIKIDSAYLIINKVSGPIYILKDEIKKSGLEVMGNIAYEEDMVKWNISARPIFEFKNKTINNEIKNILRMLIPIDQ